MMVTSLLSSVSELNHGLIRKAQSNPFNCVYLHSSIQCYRYDNMNTIKGCVLVIKVIGGIDSVCKNNCCISICNVFVCCV